MIGFANSPFIDKITGPSVGRGNSSITHFHRSIATCCPSAFHISIATRASSSRCSISDTSLKEKWYHFLESIISSPSQAAFHLRGVERAESDRRPFPRASCTAQRAGRCSGHFGRPEERCWQDRGRSVPRRAETKQGGAGTRLPGLLVTRCY